MFKNSLQTKNGPDFYYKHGATPDPNAKWVGPGGGPSSFYTTWSYYAIIATGIFATISFAILHRFPSVAKSKVWSIVILGLVIGFATNTMGVGIVSQALLTSNWKPLDPKHEVLVTESWAQKLNKINLRVHLIPILLALVLLCAVVTVPWSGSKFHLYIASCVVSTVFFFVWSLVPVPISPTSNKKTNPFTKVSTVYSSPSVPIELLLPASILLFSGLYVFVMRGNIDSHVRVKV